MASNTTYPNISESDIPPRDAKKPLVVPVGLNFGPTWLKITFFIDQDEYYTGVPGGDLYRSFIQNALSKEVQCNIDQRPSESPSASDVLPFTSEEKAKELVQAFSEHIKSAVRMGISALDKNPALHFKLMAVSVPDHWGETARTHVATAAKLAGYPLDGSHMIIPLSRAIQLTFQMSKNTEGRYLTLILDYNKSYLHLMLVESFDKHFIIETCERSMRRDVLEMKGQVYFPHLGEDELHKAPVVGSAVAADPDSLDHESVNCEPSGGLRTIGDSTDNPSTSKSAISNHSACDPPSSIQSLSLSTNNLSTSDLSGDPLPTNDPLNSEIDSSDRSAGDDSSSDKPTRGNPDDGPIPDEFYTHRPNCHNQTAHFKPIVDAVSEFMVQMTTPSWKSVPAGESSMPKYTADDVSTAVRNVKYIVIDGEASRDGMKDLGEAIANMFINEKWITVERIRSDCGAYGAALAAKRQLENPKHMDDWKDFPGYIPGRLPDVSGSD